MIKLPYIILLITTQAVVTGALLEKRTDLAPKTTKGNPVLMKILRTVEAATSDERLFDVTLKLLKSLCVCMRETLTVKHMDKIGFSGETNSLRAEDVGEDSNRKIMELYQKIYNKTCFDLKEDLAVTANKSNDDNDGVYPSNRGKKTIEDNTEGYEKLSTMVTKSVQDNERLKDIMYKTFTGSKDYHTFFIRKYSLFKTPEKYPRNRPNHSIIVILTFFSKNKRYKNKKNTDFESDELKTVLYSNSRVDIDVIDARYGQTENGSNDNFIPKEASNCTLKSIYTFVLQNAMRNNIKVFKLLRKNNSIKVYIDVPTVAHHVDYSTICCDNETLCKIDESKNSSSVEQQLKVKKRKKGGSYKDTISKIKTLVKLYDKRISNTKLDHVNSKNLTTTDGFHFDGGIPVLGLLKNKDINSIVSRSTFTTKAVPESLMLTIRDRIPMNKTTSKESWMNTVLEEIRPDETFSMYTTASMQNGHTVETSYISENQNNGKQTWNIGVFSSEKLKPKPKPKAVNKLNSKHPFDTISLHLDQLSTILNHLTTESYTDQDALNTITDRLKLIRKENISTGKQKHSSSPNDITEHNFSQIDYKGTSQVMSTRDNKNIQRSVNFPGISGTDSTVTLTLGKSTIKDQKYEIGEKATKNANSLVNIAPEYNRFTDNGATFEYPITQYSDIKTDEIIINYTDKSSSFPSESISVAASQRKRTKAIKYTDTFHVENRTDQKSTTYPYTNMNAKGNHNLTLVAPPSIKKLMYDSKTENNNITFAYSKKAVDAMKIKYSDYYLKSKMSVTSKEVTNKLVTDLLTTSMRSITEDNSMKEKDKLRVPEKHNCSKIESVKYQLTEGTLSNEMSIPSYQRNENNDVSKTHIATTIINYRPNFNNNNEWKSSDNFKAMKYSPSINSYSMRTSDSDREIKDIFSIAKVSDNLDQSDNVVAESLSTTREKPSNLEYFATSKDTNNTSQTYSNKTGLKIGIFIQNKEDIVQKREDLNMSTLATVGEKYKNLEKRLLYEKKSVSESSVIAEPKFKFENDKINNKKTNVASDNTINFITGKINTFKKSYNIETFTIPHNTYRNHEYDNSSVLSSTRIFNQEIHGVENHVNDSEIEYITPLPSNPKTKTDHLNITFHKNGVTEKGFSNVTLHKKSVDTAIIMNKGNEIDNRENVIVVTENEPIKDQEKDKCDDVNNLSNNDRNISNESISAVASDREINSTTIKLQSNVDELVSELKSVISIEPVISNEVFSLSQSNRQIINDFTPELNELNQSALANLLLAPEISYSLKTNGTESDHYNLADDLFTTESLTITANKCNLTDVLFQKPETNYTTYFPGELMYPEKNHRSNSNTIMSEIDRKENFPINIQPVEVVPVTLSTLETSYNPKKNEMLNKIRNSFNNDKFNLKSSKTDQIDKDNYTKYNNYKLSKETTQLITNLSKEHSNLAITSIFEENPITYLGQPAITNMNYSFQVHRNDSHFNIDTTKDNLVTLGIPKSSNDLKVLQMLNKIRNSFYNDIFNTESGDTDRPKSYDTRNYTTYHTYKLLKNITKPANLKADISKLVATSAFENNYSNQLPIPTISYRFVVQPTETYFKDKERSVNPAGNTVTNTLILQAASENLFEYRTIENYEYSRDTTGFDKQTIDNLKHDTVIESDRILMHDLSEGKVLINPSTLSYANLEAMVTNKFKKDTITERNNIEDTNIVKSYTHIVDENVHDQVDYQLTAKGSHHLKTAKSETNSKKNLDNNGNNIVSTRPPHERYIYPLTKVELQDSNDINGTTKNLDCVSGASIEMPFTKLNSISLSGNNFSENSMTPKFYTPEITGQTLNKNSIIIEKQSSFEEVISKHDMIKSHNIENNFTYPKENSTISTSRIKPHNDETDISVQLEPVKLDISNLPYIQVNSYPELHNTILLRTNNNNTETELLAEPIPMPTYDVTTNGDNNDLKELLMTGRARSSESDTIMSVTDLISSHLEAHFDDVAKYNENNEEMNEVLSATEENLGYPKMIESTAEYGIVSNIETDSFVPTLKANFKTSYDVVTVQTDNSTVNLNDVNYDAPLPFNYFELFAVTTGTDNNISNSAYNIFSKLEKDNASTSVHQPALRYTTPMVLNKKTDINEIVSSANSNVSLDMTTASLTNINNVTDWNRTLLEITPQNATSTKPDIKRVLDKFAFTSIIYDIATENENTPKVTLLSNNSKSNVRNDKSDLNSGPEQTISLSEFLFDNKLMTKNCNDILYKNYEHAEAKAPTEVENTKPYVSKSAAYQKVPAELVTTIIRKLDFGVTPTTETEIAIVNVNKIQNQFINNKISNEDVGTYTHSDFTKKLYPENVTTEHFTTIENSLYLSTATVKKQADFDDKLEVINDFAKEVNKNNNDTISTKTNFKTTVKHYNDLSIETKYNTEIDDAENNVIATVNGAKMGNRSDTTLLTTNNDPGVLRSQNKTRYTILTNNHTNSDSANGLSVLKDKYVKITALTKIAVPTMMMTNFKVSALTQNNTTTEINKIYFDDNGYIPKINKDMNFTDTRFTDNVSNFQDTTELNTLHMKNYTSDQFLIESLLSNYNNSILIENEAFNVYSTTPNSTIEHLTNNNNGGDSEYTHMTNNETTTEIYNMHPDYTAFFDIANSTVTEVNKKKSFNVTRLLKNTEIEADIKFNERLSSTIMHSDVSKSFLLTDNEASTKINNNNNSNETWIFPTELKTESNNAEDSRNITETKNETSTEIKIGTDLGDTIPVDVTNGKKSEVNNFTKVKFTSLNENKVTNKLPNLIEISNTVLVKHSTSSDFSHGNSSGYVNISHFATPILKKNETATVIRSFGRKPNETLDIATDQVIELTRNNYIKFKNVKLTGKEISNNSNSNTAFYEHVSKISLLFDLGSKTNYPVVTPSTYFYKSSVIDVTNSTATEVNKEKSLKKTELEKNAIDNIQTSKLNELLINTIMNGNVSNSSLLETSGKYSTMKENGFILDELKSPKKNIVTIKEIDVNTTGSTPYHSSEKSISSIDDRLWHYFAKEIQKNTHDKLNLNPTKNAKSNSTGTHLLTTTFDEQAFESNINYLMVTPSKLCNNLSTDGKHSNDEDPTPNFSFAKTLHTTTIGMKSRKPFQNWTHVIEIIDHLNNVTDQSNNILTNENAYIQPTTAITSKLIVNSKELISTSTISNINTITHSSNHEVRSSGDIINFNTNTTSDIYLTNSDNISNPISENDGLRMNDPLKAISFLDKLRLKPRNLGETDYSTYIIKPAESTYSLTDFSTTEQDTLSIPVFNSSITITHPVTYYKYNNAKPLIKYPQYNYKKSYTSNGLTYDSDYFKDGLTTHTVPTTKFSGSSDEDKVHVAKYLKEKFSNFTGEDKRFPEVSDATHKKQKNKAVDRLGGTTDDIPRQLVHAKTESPLILNVFVINEDKSNKKKNSQIQQVRKTENTIGRTFSKSMKGQKMLTHSKLTKTSRFKDTSKEITHTNLSITTNVSIISTSSSKNNITGLNKKRKSEHLNNNVVKNQLRIVLHNVTKKLKSFRKPNISDIFGKYDPRNVYVTSSPLPKSTKEIIYNTYRPKTEDEIDPPRLDTIISSLAVLNKKTITHKTSKNKKLHNKQIISKPANNRQKTRKQKVPKTVINKASLLDSIEKTHLYPVKKPLKTQRKGLKNIKLANRKSEIIPMNTDDFFSRRREIERGVRFDNLPKLHPKLESVHRPATVSPRQVVLRPIFKRITNHKKNDLNVKPVIIQETDKDFYRGIKPEQFKNGIGHRPQGTGYGEPVLDKPYYFPVIMKPTFLRDKVNSIRSYIYNSEVGGTRKHFLNSPPDLIEDEIDPLVYYSKGNSMDEDTAEVTDLWLDDMYLKVRVPLPINSNPGMVFPPRRFAKVDEVADLAALFIDDLLDYKEMLDRGELPLERATSREKGQPLCMEQFYRLLGVCRIPQLGKDRLELPPMRAEGEQEELVIVACRNHFYPIPVKAGDRGRLTPGEMQAQLLAALVDAAGAPPAPRVGLLTALPRDRWARARDLMCADDTNRANLELISRALCVVCLDEGEERGAGAADDTAALRRAMHGGGSARHSANRWFDKTVQLIISSDGMVGMCYEHSAAEGVAVVRLAERALARAAVAARPAPPPALLPAPQAMAWALGTEVERMVEQAAEEVDRNIADLDVRVWTFDGYGREFMKGCRTSPDVYIQLALQYAYYKMYGHLVSTYESASLRRFRQGRVDNIRSAHAQARAWAAHMCDGEPTPTADDHQKKEQKKLQLFEEAAKKQTAIMEAVIQGRGIDNHLLGLREIARETMGQLPELFTDPTYKLMNEFKLSTSQVATTTDGTFMGYGAVVPDGYGCSYNPKKDSVIFCISSFVSSSVTNTEAFRQHLEEALESMKLMFQHRQTE